MYNAHVYKYKYNTSQLLIISFVYNILSYVRIQVCITYSPGPGCVSGASI